MDNDSNDINNGEEVDVQRPFSGSILHSKTGHLDDTLKERLERAFHKPTSQVLLHGVAKIASEHDPIDLAYAASRLPTSARPVLYENLPDFHAKIIFITNTGSNTRSVIFRQIDNREISALLASMPPDEAVSMLDDMSDRKMRRVLGLLKPKKANRLRELLKHDRNTAGRLMSNEFFAFTMDTSIGEVASHIRDNPGIELTRRVFVLGNNGQLVGYVPERNLIVNPDEWPLRQVMHPVLHTLTAAASRDEMVDVMERYKIPTLAIIDENERLVGVISHVDAMEAMEDIADETIASIAGTAEDVSEHEPTFRRFIARTPWLLITLCAGLISAGIMTRFSSKEWWLGFIPFFVPLITGMSGNIGIQCSTVLVRGISTGEITAGSRRDAIYRELTIGLLIGSAFGLVCGLVVFEANQLGIHHLDADPIVVGTIVSCGVFCASMTATVLGTFSPFLFARLRIDPAVAAGPIVTAFNDVLSALIFFFVARGVSALFWGW